MKLQVWPPHWFFVMLRFLAFGDIVQVEIPDHVRNEPRIEAISRDSDGSDTFDGPKA
jgi:hypothetical protein